MRLKIDHCYYELVKDLFNSYDSLIQSVEKEKDGVLVTLHKGHSLNEFIRFINQDPLYTLCKSSQISIL